VTVPDTGKARRIDALGCVLAGALVLRVLVPILAVLFTADLSVYHTPDTKSYLALAGEMAREGRFARQGEPELVRTPGYPLLLAPGALLGEAELVAISLQIVLSCLTVWVVYQIGRLVFPHPGAALLGALLYAIEPLSVVYCSKLLTETLFTFSTVLFVYYLLRYLAAGGVRELLFSAAALAASIYVRPISYFLPGLVCAGLVVRALYGGEARGRRLGHAAAFLALSMGPVGGWQIRNAAAAGYGGFSAIADQNLYFYQAASVRAAAEGESYYTTQAKMGCGNDAVYFESHPDQRGWTAARRFRFRRREGAGIVMSHPLTYAGIHLKGMMRALLDPGAMELLKLFKLYPQRGGLLGVVVDKGLAGAVGHLARNRPLVFWSSLGLGLMLCGYWVLALVGLVWGGFLRRGPGIVLVLVALYFLVMSGGPQAVGRFRHPIMPAVCVFGGIGLWLSLRKLVGKGATPRAAAR